MPAYGGGVGLWNFAIAEKNSPYWHLFAVARDITESNSDGNESKRGMADENALEELGQHLVSVLSDQVLATSILHNELMVSVPA